jgi:hypothetical protein
VPLLLALVRCADARIVRSTRAARSQGSDELDTDIPTAIEVTPLSGGIVAVLVVAPVVVARRPDRRPGDRRRSLLPSRSRSDSNPTIA